MVTYYSGDFSPTLGTLSGEALLLLLPTPPSAPPGFPQRPALVGVLLARSTPSPLLPAEVDPPPDPASPCPCQHACCLPQRLPPPSPPLSCYCLHSACLHQGCETRNRNRIFTQTHKPQVCPGNKNLLPCTAVNSPVIVNNCLTSTNLQCLHVYFLSSNVGI